jgi:WD40 repeat protein/serine/threonine protein kinase
MSSATPDVKSIFGRALELDAGAARAAYLEAACGTNAALRGEVEGLLQALERAGGFLKGPAPAVTMDEPPAPERPGTWIGPYKLLEKIGERGMGEVWVADQQEPIRRRVAVKVIKPGMDSRAVLARFEAERQALALMDHPNIAKVLDAGSTADGRPYFVMDLVKGTPITQFCDLRKLSPRQRLELFVPVCQAIQHAHQKGVIHRDIRPSNVLVELYDDRPVPKVIDFGVAKAVGQRLTERTRYTGFGALVGTPAYMAPEQATFNALDVDTRADVYSLGVLLYELLAGSPPFEPEQLKKAALDEVLRLVREQEPPRPSTRLSTSQAKATIAAVRQSDPDKLARLMRGELDWIVMKALEKDRTRRYETANGLARDVERYLKGETVEACPPTVGYRLRKFAPKHKPALITAAAFAALLVGGAALSLWQAVRASHAEAVALAERDDREQARQAEAEQRAAAVQERAATLAAKEELRRTLYAAEMNLVQAAWEENNVGHVHELPDRWRPRDRLADLRGFEWHCWQRRCHSALLTLKHAGDLGGVVFSSDGERIASIARTGTLANVSARVVEVQVWDAATGQLLFSEGEKETIPSPLVSLRSPAFSKDGRYLAWGSADGAIRLRDPATGKVFRTFTEHSAGVLGVAFSHDGRRLASINNVSPRFPEWRCELRMWDVATGKEVLAPKPLPWFVTSMAFSPDDRRLAASSWVGTNGKGGGAYVWDTATGDEVLFLPHGRDTWSVAFRPDGKQIATASSDETVRVWDTADGKPLLTLKGHTGWVYAVAYSPNGQRLAMADRTVRIWDADTSTQLFTHRGRTYPVAYSPDGKRIASGSADRTVKVWDAQVESELRFAAKSKKFSAIQALSPDGQRLADMRPDGTLVALAISNATNSSQ